MMIKSLSAGIAILAALLQPAVAQYADWQHSGSLYIITTPEGADLPASTAESNFPLLVRLNKYNFDFSQAKSGGEDIRFSAGGIPLAYQVEEWDPANGTASIWVRIPAINGNARQEIKLHWGKADAASASSAAAVFNADNGYATVIHMDEPLKDDVGTVTPVDKGTTPAAGMIGKCRHFSRGMGINCGDHITNYPYSDNPFTFEGWFRAEQEAAGSMILYYGRYATRYNGRTGDGNEVGISFGSPPSLTWASDGPGGAGAASKPEYDRWYHIAATYEAGMSRIYVNGMIDGSNYHKAAMSVTNDICMNLGGVRGGGYQFAGDIDEVRVSRVARSPDWMKLQYENQKAGQTLVGSLVQSGSALSATPAKVEVMEGKSATITAQAGSAQKVYWIVKRDGTETIAAVDRLSFAFDAGRVTADTSCTIQFKAVYAGETKTITIPVTIREDIPEPVFTLKAPARWDGREQITVTPQVANLKEMQSKGAGRLDYKWTVSNIAVIKAITPAALVLKRAQNSGTMIVRLTAHNGGAEVTRTVAIRVTEPRKDAWVQRKPGTDEKPEDNQFYARDDRNEGTLYCNGSLPGAADSVFLRLYADGKLIRTDKQKPGKDKSYAFTVKLKPGLIRYKVELGTLSSGTETVLNTATNLVCGDAYIIDGQSNAEATGPNNGKPPESEYYTSEWIRSYGNQHDGSARGGWGIAVRTHKWGTQEYGNHQIGTWGMVLASNLLARYKMPICIINGAYGGTPIWHHQPNPTNHFDTSGGFYQNPYKIYGGILTRVTAARLTHGIRGVLWHQGENDQGSGAPTGDYNWKSYQQYFVDMSAAWKEDYPNIRNYYVFQIWPSACNMGGTTSGDMLHEVQRTLPFLYSNMRIMSTLGIVFDGSGRGMCHFDLEGYAQLAKLMGPLVEVDNYGLIPTEAVTAPNLRRAWFTGAARDAIALDFGQPMDWNDVCKAWLRLDEAPAAIASGKAAGNVITIKLSGPSTAKTISYASGKNWDGRPDKLLYGSNGITALAFSYVPIEQQP